MATKAFDDWWEKVSIRIAQQTSMTPEQLGLHRSDTAVHWSYQMYETPSEASKNLLAYLGVTVDA